MSRVKALINRLSKTQKITYLFLVLGLILMIAIAIPTLSRYKHRSTIVLENVWDGSIADNYNGGDGSVNNPYVISNGSELAYLSEQLLSNNYDDTYFTLSNDIVLNDGVFKYNSNGKIEYILNSVVYYVDYYTNKYYDNPDMLGEEVGTVNILNSLANFKGSFSGSSYTIFGLYVTKEDSEEVSLFTNLEGEVSDLYVENAMVYGGIITGGISSNATNSLLSNIIFDGYVVGRNNQLSKSVSADISTSIINVTNTSKDDNVSLSNKIPFVGSSIISSSISGNYTVNAPVGAYVSIKINGIDLSDGSFNIALGSSEVGNVVVTTYTDSLEAVTVDFSNLKYNISYDYATSGGIVAYSNNNDIRNTVNKAEIYGYSTAGGLIGVSTNTTNINQSYNTGNVTSEHVSGGLIGTIEKSSNNITISNCYNTGDMYASTIGGIIGTVNNNSGFLSINNVFNTSTTDFTIGKVNNTVVNVANAYYVNGVAAVGEGTINGTFAVTTINDLKTKNYTITTLGFSEFVDFDDLLENENNVWIYAKESLPILFIDDVSEPIAILHAGVHSWSNFSVSLDTFRFDDNITFSIEESNELEPIKEKYYYISNSNVPLTEEDVTQITTWTTYNNIVQINEEGLYIIYLKIVDFDDNVTYINSDLLILDLFGSSVDISSGDATWSLFRDELDYLYIDRSIQLTITASDAFSGIASVKYYTSEAIMSSEDLDSLGDSSWVNYYSPIAIDNTGKYIIYAKVIDNSNHVTYANTDFIVFGGYVQENIIIGRNSSSYSSYDPYITNGSIVTLNFKYQDDSAEEFSDYTHNLLSTILLPLGTRILLIDNINDKVYEYKINTSDDIFNYNESCQLGDLDCENFATYPFSLFKEVGTANLDKYFIEDDYYVNGVVSEDFSIVMDFSGTNTNINYENILIYMQLHNNLGANVRPTMHNSLKRFGVYSTVNETPSDANLHLETNYSGSPIVLGSSSSTDINITSKIDYKKLDEKTIIDTSYEDKVIGLSIRMVDGNNNIIDSDYYKNVSFKIGDNTYYPGVDNIVRISFQEGVMDITKNLTIITKEDNNVLLNGGMYYFKISSYASIDGNYYDLLSGDEISVPVSVLDASSNKIYGFDVKMDDSSRIISKTNEQVEIPLKILQNGYTLVNPNIRVSLYKKDQLTAYDQNYSLVDLASFVTNSLNMVSDNVYYVSTSPIQYDGTENTYNLFNLNLITANFENTGYKFVFDLYDDTRKVGTIEKYFIVK